MITHIRNHFLSLLFLVCVFSPQSLFPREATPAKIKTLYASLDPNSISEYLAFYQLYPHTAEGKQALQDAWHLLNKNRYQESIVGPFDLQDLSLETNPHASLSFSIDAIVSLINKEPNDETPKLTSRDLALIDKLCGQLGNRQLKGYKASTEQEIIDLRPNEIDLARGLFLSQLGNSPEATVQLQSYEALIDLMALQILTRLPPKRHMNR